MGTASTQWEGASLIPKPPPATGAASINQAVKSICIARQYLTRDETNLSFQVRVHVCVVRV